MIIDKKVFILTAIGLVVTFLVYIGLQNSLRVPSLSSTPISSETAVMIVAKKQNLTVYNVNDFYTRYVYIKGDGTIFESDIGSNSIGKYFDKTKPTITTGNHFAWMVKRNSHGYFVDAVTGEIISE
ncbi:MAG: hypothetical protein ACJ72U_17365 [Nitrososphaeraceae archaeon]